MIHFMQRIPAAPTWVSHIHNTASHEEESGDFLAQFIANGKLLFYLIILETSRNFIYKAPKPSSWCQEKQKVFKSFCNFIPWFTVCVKYAVRWGKGGEDKAKI